MIREDMIEDEKKPTFRLAEEESEKDQRKRTEQITFTERIAKAVEEIVRELKEIRIDLRNKGA